MSFETIASSAATLRPSAPRQCEFRSDVLQGLRKSPKRLSCKYLYDRRGSQLFDAICELPEYYLTRTELQITRRFAREIAEQIGPNAALIEFGSGSSLKTRILLDHLEPPTIYIPVDISQDHLHQAASELDSAYPQLKVRPVCADFTQEFELPLSIPADAVRNVYFPGSTIGNFQPLPAQALLKRIGKLIGVGGGLLVGIDLQKSVSIIEAAYNDSQGITEKFSLNLLRRINRELGADFDLNEFYHRAIYDSNHGRMDIRLVSKRDQLVCIGNHGFEFAAGESIHTEYSYKHTIPGFTALAAAAGFELQRHWSDDRNYFGLLYLTRAV